MKKITERLEEAVNRKRNQKHSAQLDRCMQFVNKMKDAGLLNTANQTPSPVREGGLEQLSLYASNFNLLR
jgi:hypothetical protein